MSELITQETKIETPETDPDFETQFAKESAEARQRIQISVGELVNDLKLWSANSEQIGQELAELVEQNIQPLLDMWDTEQKAHPVLITYDIPGSINSAGAGSGLTELRLHVRTTLDRLYQDSLDLIVDELINANDNNREEKAEQIRWFYFKHIVESIDQGIELITPNGLSRQIDNLDQNAEILISYASGIEHNSDDQIDAMTHELRAELKENSEIQKMGISHDDLYELGLISTELLVNAGHYATYPGFNLYLSNDRNQLKLTIVIYDHGAKDRNTLTLDRVPTIFLPGLSANGSLGRGSQDISGFRDALETATCHEQMVINEDEASQNFGTTVVLTVEPKNSNR
jgi:anti-sigma regulatory factor (Ser/Thr protein kinase)